MWVPAIDVCMVSVTCIEVSRHCLSLSVHFGCMPLLYHGRAVRLGNQVYIYLWEVLGLRHHCI